MASWQDVRGRALALPGTDEIERRGTLAWRVAGKGFVWERPLNKSDLKRLKDAGEDPPEGLILAARVDDEGVKAAVIAADPEVYFTIVHFNGFNAVLALLERMSAEQLDELVTDAWLAVAPPKLAKEFLADPPADT
jgi:hypothetical protein